MINTLRKRLDSADRGWADEGRYRHAAVLVPLIQTDAGLRVLYIRRAEDEGFHSGQVAFPGGRPEADESPLQAAVRETHEEVGLAPAVLEPLGFLPRQPVLSRYMLEPLVALVHDTDGLTPSEAEVARIFTVSVDDLRNPELQFDGPLPSGWPGPDARLHQYRIDGEVIWGATGSMTTTFLEHLGD